jgi:hypothetical protein
VEPNSIPSIVPDESAVIRKSFSAIALAMDTS